MGGAENVCVTTGSQEALSCAIRALCDPATDDLLVVTPAFPAYVKMAELEGIAVRTVAMRRERDYAFDVDAILAALEPRTRMLVICSPCNPTGRTFTDAQARALARGLDARGGTPVTVVHDELYRELRYVEDVGKIGRYWPHVVSVNSLSKSNALTGLRLGWTIAPAAQSAAIVKMHAWTTSCASTFGQRVALELIRADGLGAHRAHYAAQRDAALAAARAAGLRAIEPEGAFYLCVETGRADDVAFARELLDAQDVVAIPGSIFGEELRGFVRTSFVRPVADLAEAYARIARFRKAG